METLDYTALEKEIQATIDRTKVMVLATSANNRVTARSMSIVNDGLTIYFQADTASDKASQIRANPLVALCAGNMQIEGTARFVGHPDQNDPECQFFARQYSQTHAGSFDTYSHYDREVVVAVQPTRITLYQYPPPDHQPCRDILDISQQSAQRVWVLADLQTEQTSQQR